MVAGAARLLHARRPVRRRTTPTTSATSRRSARRSAWGWRSPSPPLLARARARRDDRAVRAAHDQPPRRHRRRPPALERLLRLLLALARRARLLLAWLRRARVPPPERTQHMTRIERSDTRRQAAPARRSPAAPAQRRASSSADDRARSPRRMLEPVEAYAHTPAAADRLRRARGRDRARSARVPERLKALAELKAATLVELRVLLRHRLRRSRAAAGISDEQLLALPRYRESALLRRAREARARLRGRA